MSIEGVPLAVAGGPAIGAASRSGQAPAATEPRAGQATSRPAPVRTRDVPVQDLQERLEIINRALEDGRRNLFFSVDESTGKTVVRVVRPDTGEVLRQIPSDEALAIAAAIAAGEPLNSLGVERTS